MTNIQYISVIPSNKPVNNIPSNTPVNNITFVLIQLHYFMTRTFKKCINLYLICLVKNDINSYLSVYFLIL